MRKKALITGITGQDGAYLAEFLIKKGGILQRLRKNFFFSNSAYAVAKIAGIEMCWSYNRQHHTKFIPVMPTNLYGPNDNFDLTTSHVLPALIRKFHEAKQAAENAVIVWGTGTPRREFLHVDDLAEACVYLMNLSEQKLLDVSKLTDLGWLSKIDLKQGINSVYDLFYHSILR